MATVRKLDLPATTLGARAMTQMRTARPAETPAPIPRGRREPTLDRLESALFDVMVHEDGWNGPGSEGPTVEAVGAALLALDHATGDLIRASAPPFVKPSAEGGVALGFSCEQRRAIVEFLNNGTVNLVTYKNGSVVDALADSDGSKLIRQAAAFISGK